MMCHRAHSWRPGERPAGGVALVWGAGPCPASPARLAAAPFCEEDFKALTGGAGLRLSGSLPGLLWGAARPGVLCGEGS